MFTGLLTCPSRLALAHNVQWHGCAYCLDSHELQFWNDFAGPGEVVGERVSGNPGKRVG
jgi:hypothetical protein